MKVLLSIIRLANIQTCYIFYEWLGTEAGSMFVSIYLNGLTFESILLKEYFMYHLAAFIEIMILEINHFSALSRYKN